MNTLRCFLQKPGLDAASAAALGRFIAPVHFGVSPQIVTLELG